MSGTYAFCQTPLKSTLPECVRGVGPTGGWNSRWPAASIGKATAIANRLAAKCFFTSGSYFFGGRGGSPAEDPAKTLRPSGSLTARALHGFEPSFGISPYDGTWSPTFKESIL